MVSYYYDEFALFNSNPEIYKEITNAVKINYTNEKALFIRIDLSDIGFSYKSVQIFKNDIPIHLLHFSFSKETAFYYEAWPSSFLPIKDVAVRSIFIPITTPITNPMYYTINAYDKIGNALNVDITINQELKDDIVLTETAKTTSFLSSFSLYPSLHQLPKLFNYIERQKTKYV